MEAADSHLMKNLKTQLKKARKEYESAEHRTKKLEDKLVEAQEELIVLKTNITEIQEQIDALTEKYESMEIPIVTEHALLRYVEHVMGVDLDEVKNNILNEKTINAYRQLGNGKYPVMPNGTGCRALIRDNTVITVIGPPKKK